MTSIPYSLSLCILAFKVDGFDAIFDCITNMIGRFFICQLSSRRHVTMQACKRLDGEERAGCFALFVFLVSCDG